jgi:hypothetical protein
MRLEYFLYALALVFGIRLIETLVKKTDNRCRSDIMQNTEKIRAIFALFLVAGAVLSIGACAKPPTEEMEAATAAVTRAENDADAVTYAGNTLARAREALNRMSVEANSKRYDAAKSFAAEAIAAADKAVSDGRTGAARAREEASSLIGLVRTGISETADAIRAAQSSGKVGLDYAVINRDFEAVRRSADQAEISLAGNNYQEALDRGRSARAGLSDINQKLAAAATAASRKK